MQVEVRGRSLSVTGALKEYIQRRVAFALDRFWPQVERVVVRVTGDGDGRGVGMTCSISASGSALPAHIVAARNEDLYAAIDIAAGRLGRQVARTLDRRAILHRAS